MLKQLADQASKSIEAQREELTMALYMAIVTLSVLVFDKPAESAWEDVRLIVGSAVGILAAHLLAFRLSARYHHGEHESTEAGEGDDRSFTMVDVSTFALIRASVLVIGLACLPYLFLSLDAARWVSFLLLTVIVGLAAYAVADSGGRSRSRALLYAVIVMVLAIAVAALKSILSH